MQQLGHDQVGDLVVDRGSQEDDPLVEQTAVDVESALPAGGLLHHHGYEWAHVPRFFCLHARIPAECSNRLPGGHSASVPAHRRVSVQLRSPASRSCPAAPDSSSLPGVHSFLCALRLLDGDRLGLADEQLDGLTVGHVLSDRRPAGRSSAGPRAASRRSCRRVPRPARALASTSSSVGSICSACTIAASTASRRSALAASGSASWASVSSSLPAICR